MIRICAVIASSLLVLVPSTAAGQEQLDQAATSSAGHVAFETRGGPNDTSILRVVAPDGKVGAPQAIQAPEDDIELAVGPTGATIAAYIADDALYARYMAPGGALGPLEQVTASADFLPETIPLGIDAAGNATIAWVPKGGAGGLEIATRAAARGWSAPQVLGGTDIYDPEITVSSNGGSVLAWRQHAGKGLNSHELVVSTRAPGGAFSAPSVLAGVAHDADEPAIGLNERGDAAIEWTEVHGEHFSVHARVRAAGQPRFGRTFQVSHIDAADPTVAVLPNGRIIMADAEWTNRRVEARVPSTSGRLGRPTILTHDLGVNAQISVLASGRGVVGWIDHNPGVIHTKVAQATADGRFGKPQVVATVHGWALDPVFSATPTSLAVVADPPLTARAAIHWTPIKLK